MDVAANVVYIVHFILHLEPIAIAHTLCLVTQYDSLSRIVTISRRHKYTYAITRDNGLINVGGVFVHGVGRCVIYRVRGKVGVYVLGCG